MWRSVQPGRREIVRIVIAAAFSWVVGWQVLVAGLPPIAVTAGAPEQALAINPAYSPAHSILAVTALGSRHFTDAHAEALAALAATPINQQALTVAAATVSPPRSTILLNLSAGLGWRDYGTQLVLAQQGIDHGDATLFAQRIDAYERQEATPSVRSLLDRYIADSSVQKAVALRLGTSPNWRLAYLNSVPSLDPRFVAARVALMSLLAERGSPPSADEVSGLFDKFALSDQSEQAYALWRKFIAFPGGWGGLLYDGGFARVDAHSYPYSYEWTTQDTAGAYASAETMNMRTALHLHSEGLAEGPLARQTLRLVPGRYRLGLKVGLQDETVAPVDGTAPSDFAVSIACPDGRELIEGNNGEGASMHVGFHVYYVDVPATCRQPILSLRAIQGVSGVTDDLWVQSARLDRFGR
jgi:hypothetical protein